MGVKVVVEQRLDLHVDVRLKNETKCVQCLGGVSHHVSLASCHSSLTGGGGQGLVDTRPLDCFKDLQTLVERHL